MELTVVGCAGSFPRPGAACSSYLVEAEGFRLLLDMGNGALGALQQHIGLYDLDALLLTHLHGDHCLDASSYVVARRFRPEGPLPPLPLYGPAGTLARLARAYEVAREATPLDDVYQEQVLTPGTVEVGPFRLTVDRTNHPVETYGVRLEHGGRALAYSADSGASDALVSLARDSDVFLCEASYNELPPGAPQDNPPNLHLTGAEAGAHAAQAGAGRLLLTHLSAWTDPEQTLDEVTGAFAGPVTLVAAGDAYDI